MSNYLPHLPQWLLQASLQGTMAVALVWLFAPLVRRLLGAQAAYLLWALVLLRLLVPWQPASPLPVGGPTLTVQPGEPGRMSGLKIRISTEIDEEELGKVGTAKPEWKAPEATVVWLAGVGLVLGFSAVRSWRASRLARRARDLAGDPDLEPTRQELEPWLRGVRIKETGELRSPALTGLWRPVILLPLDWRERLTGEQLRCVLAHEAGHHSRGDLLWRWAFLIARSVHWWNPFVWLAERTARTDQEMACDEWALQRQGTESYGEALLVSAQKLTGGRARFSVQADMAESRAGLKRRILQISRTRSRGWLAALGGVLFTVLLFIVTGPARSDEAPKAAATPDASQAAVPESTPAPAAEPAKTEEPRKVADARANIMVEIKVLEIPPEIAAPNFGGKPAADGSVGVQAVYRPKEFADFLGSLNEKPGVDLVSAPTVTTKSGLRCTIQVVREFRYPTEYDQADKSATGGLKIPPTPTAFETKPVGLTIECEPAVLKDGALSLVLGSRVTEFQGFVDFGKSRPAKADLKEDALLDQYVPDEGGWTIKQPVFATREFTNRVTVRSGETLVMGGITSDFGRLSDMLDANKLTKPGEAPAKKVLFVFVTATRLKADGQKEGGAAAALPASLTQDGIRLFARPVPNRPGLVLSPYAPGAGYVDVRGHTVGSAVRDPYTGQLFFIAPEDGSHLPDPEPDPRTMEGRARRIMIPGIEFQGATLRQALDSIRQMSEVCDDAEQDEAKRGVSLVLKQGTDGKEPPPITAKLTNVSVYEALKFVAEKANLFVVGEPYAMSLVPEKPVVLATRRYELTDPILAKLEQVKGQEGREFWQARGVTLVPGASVVFRPPAQLVMKNSPEGHEEMARLLADSVAGK